MGRKVILQSSVLKRSDPVALNGPTSVQFKGKLGSGSGSAEAKIYCGNDDSDMILAGTINLTLNSSGFVQDGFAILATWAFMIAEITAVSGTSPDLIVSIATN